ncbi:putative acetyltransferase protein [Oceaniovalibus guishaninsula JLT2003]|uniref:Putative acetyltransferase protein n=1 Tax=Oceaniovalibus guishaninsula JLT2003 TaxID=1231392 RepID=K2I5C7_9RHOB|nr:GNAT family N-acetyltransferase [Oceaniovalibus guishaninsula]EKE44105.1 putative acetyltransferase protein [Oceaniovalibus guishaninsula JLT2003]
MRIERAGPGDGDALWSVLRPAIRAGDTYALPPDVTRADALAYWGDPAHEVWIASGDLGSYYLRANQRGNGDHVCNAAFATRPAARGQGVARAMLDHALGRARGRGFAAMQFNFVVASNVRALAIWRDYGFDIVGRVPHAFRHPQRGPTDALILHRFL